MVAQCWTTRSEGTQRPITGSVSVEITGASAMLQDRGGRLQDRSGGCKIEAGWKIEAEWKIGGEGVG